MNYIELIFIIFILSISFVIYKILFKKCSNYYEKILFTYFCFIIFLITILYYIDFYNIPSYFGWNKNININEWHSFLFSFCGIILGEMFAGIILYFMTKMQITETIDAEKENNKIEHRINNMPLLIYEFRNVSNKDSIFIKTNIENNTIPVNLNLSIKNIGLNTTKKCFVKIFGDVIKSDNESEVYQLPNQGCIEKNATQVISFLINLKRNNKYNFDFDIYYQDLMNNWYLQHIDLEYNLTNYFRTNSSYLSNNRLIVYEEKLLDKTPSFKIINVK